MQTLLQEIPGAAPLDAVAAHLRHDAGLALLRSFLFDRPATRYSLLAARPRVVLQARGACCEIRIGRNRQTVFGNPWALAARWLARFELPNEFDCPFPLGGCFGFWGYGLKHFAEPQLLRRAVDDLGLPDCHLGFYDSLVIVDHLADKSWIVSTGLEPDGSRSRLQAQRQADFWRRRLETAASDPALDHCEEPLADSPAVSTMSREAFLAGVRAAQHYIRHGHIYQVNLSHRLTVSSKLAPWDFFRRLSAVSPAPLAAYLDCGLFQLVSSSPELFLRLSGNHIETRPIKGTRPRSPDPLRDAQLQFELQTSAKELAELVMITDLLRNDLGKVCEYGSVQVPDLARLERFAQVQHLVSTVEGQLRSGLTHLEALASCFPGGSITGAPKIRAMDIIEEIEPVARGPYTGCHGFLGFNRESQLAITIRSAFCQDGRIHFPVGAGIVADSQPEAEYAETLDKAGGFWAALQMPPVRELAARPV